MKLHKYLLLVVLLSVFTGRTQAAIITVGDHEIAPNAITDIQIFIAREISDPDIIGITLDLQITDGSVVDGPEIQSVDLVTGTIFATNHDDPINTGDAGTDPPQEAFWEISIDFDAAPLSPIMLPDNGLLATITIDATGITEPATYNLTASSFNSNGTPSGTELLDSNGDPVTPTVVDGTLTIVPEPATLTVWITCALLAYRTRRLRA